MVGKPKLDYARAGVDEYIARIRLFTDVQLHMEKASNAKDESAALLRRSEGMFRVVLDERGALVRSRDLATKLDDWNLANRDCALLVGGADGWTEEVRKSAGWLWSLSPMTLQHELALVVALEQIYRAHTIRARMPYHREG